MVSLSPRKTPLDVFPSLSKSSAHLCPSCWSSRGNAAVRGQSLYRPVKHWLLRPLPSRGGTLPATLCRWRLHQQFNLILTLLVL